MKRYFSYDEDDGFSYHDTLAEAEAAANKAIKGWCEGGEWLDEVNSVIFGEIKAVATQVDRVDRPEDDEIDEEGCDGEGTYWGSDTNYRCDYMLKGL